MSDEPNQALAVIPATALPIILAADQTDILGRIKRRVDACTRDASTEGGRDEIRSVAYDVARAKTTLIKLGKGLTEDWRKSTAAVNAECREIETRMSTLQDAVRAPLTAYENAEKARVASHETLLARIVGEAAPTDDIAVINDRLTWLRGIDAYQWQEFSTRANDAIALSIAALGNMKADILRRAADAAELARLRAKEAEEAAALAEKERIDRETRIAAEAADRARRGAEAVAAEQAATAARVARERERQAQVQIARMEQDRIDAITKAERERLDMAEAARLKAIVDGERAARETREAIARERQRADMEAAMVQAEADARAADVAHRAAINGEAVAGMIDAAERWDIELIVNYGGAKDDLFEAIITAIAKGEVPHVTINY